MPETVIPIPADEFHLAITMAGAASAGCYTGGVIDYLFEVLDLWEKARNRKIAAIGNPEKLVPPHRVIIDAMGGTSAGGMTATMAAIYALNGVINPVKDPSNIKENKNNLFYDSWVLMEDMNVKDQGETFNKVWDTKDLEDGKVRSLLNSQFIDSIADRSFIYDHDILKQATHLPPYISPNLQMILSHCLLRGIPLEVNFETPIGKKGHKSVLPNHTTFEHYVVSHYHLNQGIMPKLDKYLWLNPYQKEYADTLKLSTKATGAFPVGLLYRKFSADHFSNLYLRTTLKRIILGELGSADPDPDNFIKLKYLADDFSSFTVDGGAINNEPYREVNSLLKNQFGPTPEDGYPRYGVVMIDPFPDRAQTAAPYEKPEDLLDVIPEIIGTLTDQSRIKRREVLENDSKESFRSIIFPRKWKVSIDEETKILHTKPDSEPIACSSAMAFGGLLDIGFRHHDFFLGRNNLQEFLTVLFSFPYDKAKGVVHPIHTNWKQEMIDTFLIKKNDETYLPIIPDLNLLLEKTTAQTFNQFSYDVKDKPLYDPKRLFNLQPVMDKRFLRIIELLKNRKSANKAISPSANKWLEGHYKTNGWTKLKDRVTTGLINLGFSIFKKSIAKKMTKMAITKIITDLDKTKCLERPKNN